jgi:hypothetical protein
MSLVANHYGQIVGEPFEYGLTVPGVETFIATVDAVVRRTDAACPGVAGPHTARG